MVPPISYRRGELVWARVSKSPETWWPALVLSLDNLNNPSRVLLSFFNFDKRRHLNLVDTCSFEENFHSLIHTLKCDHLFKFALKLWAQRVAINLTCRCMIPRGDIELETNQFSDGVLVVRDLLGFVLRVAVRPTFEDAEVVTAVTVAAQIKMVRQFLLIQQKGLYLEAARQSPVIQEAEIPNSKVKCLVSTKQIGKSSRAHLAKRINLEISGKSFEPLHRDQQPVKSTKCAEHEKAQSVHVLPVLLHRLALYPFHFWEKGIQCLSTFENSFLSFRNLSYKTASDLLSGECCPKEVGRAYFAHSDDCSLKPNIFINGSVNSKGGKLSSSLIRSRKSIASYVKLKRRLDHTAFSPCSKLLKTMHYSDGQVTTNKACLTDSFVLFSRVPLKFKLLEQASLGIRSLTFACKNSQDLFQNKLNVTSDLSRIGQIAKVQEFQKDANIPNDGATCIKLLRSRKSFNLFDQKVHNSSRKIVNGILVQDVEVDSNLSGKQPTATELAFKDASTIETDDGGADLASVTGNYLPSYHSMTEQTKMQPRNGCDATSSAPSNEVNINMALKCSFDKRNKLHQMLPKDKAISSGKIQHCSADILTLYMKFPRDFHLPSKEKLIKIFSPFGSIHASETKVFYYMGSAQVAFLDHADAVVAYQYAKRKKVLFGQVDVKYWLDPFEGKRKAIQRPISLASLTTKQLAIKSCLKRSNPLEKDVKKKPYRVRFRMET